MKVYCIEYDFTIISVVTGEEISTEHRIETFYNVTEFIDRTKYLNEHNTSVCGKRYIFNLKVYSGNCHKLNIENIINPF